MIKMVDRHNRRAHRDILDQHFRLHQDIFVRERGWIHPDRDEIYEKDRYDTDDAIYMIAIDGKVGDVTGCYRLYPTTIPHSLSETFPHLVDGEIPRCVDVLELTRFALRESVRRGPACYELLASLQEYGLRAGVRAFSAVIRTTRLPTIQVAGTTVSPLGLPREIDGKSFVAVLLGVSEANLARALTSGGLTGSVFYPGADVRQVA